jgi:hypothetical protein
MSGFKLFLSSAQNLIDRSRRFIATMLKDDQENKILIGSFLAASCKEAFEMDVTRHAESTIMDRLETDLNENDDGYRLTTKSKDRNDDLDANKSLHLLDSI